MAIMNVGSFKILWVELRFSCCYAYVVRRTAGRPPCVWPCSACLERLSFKSVIQKGLLEQYSVIAEPCFILGRRKSHRKSSGSRHQCNIWLHNPLPRSVSSCSPWMRWRSRRRTRLWLGLQQQWGCITPCSNLAAAVSRPIPRNQAPGSSTRPDPK